MTKELLSQIANMELRDQLETKEQMIKELKEKLEIGNAKLKKDCRTLAQKLLQVKPELREWLEINFKEYL